MCAIPSGTTIPAFDCQEKEQPTSNKRFAGHIRQTRRPCCSNEAEGEGLNRKSDAIYAMVKDFKRRCVPIDGVGLQMHIPALDVDIPAIAANIARLTALGVQVHITELDVSLPVDS